jgi:hypothetical protein
MTRKNRHLIYFSEKVGKYWQSPYHSLDRDCVCLFKIYLKWSSGFNKLFQSTQNSLRKCTVPGEYSDEKFLVADASFFTPKKFVHIIVCMQIVRWNKRLLNCSVMGKLVFNLKFVLKSGGGLWSVLKSISSAELELLRTYIVKNLI